MTKRNHHPGARFLSYACNQKLATNFQKSSASLQSVADCNAGIAGPRAGAAPGLDRGDLTASWPTPAIYLDPARWKELQRRNALQGNHVNLGSYR